LQNKGVSAYGMFVVDDENVDEPEDVEEEEETQ
jgi:hypothetical protein